MAKTICDNCIHDEVCGLEGHLDEALTFCANKAADVQPVSVIKELQEHIKQSILETAFNNGGIYGEVAEDIANRIDMWVDEFGRIENG